MASRFSVIWVATTGPDGSPEGLEAAMALARASLPKPRYLARISSGAEVRAPLIWFSSAVRAFTALVRAVRSTRSASTHPLRVLGVEVPLPLRTDSAAW